MISNNKRWKRIYFTAISFLIIISFISGYFIYSNQKEAETHEKIIEIESLSSLKIRQVSEWYKDEINDALVITRNENLVKAAKLALESPTDENIQLLYKVINVLKSEHGYADILLKTGNKILFQANHDTSGQSKLRLIQPIIHYDLPYSGVFINDKRQTYIDLTSKLFKNSDGESVYLTFRLDPELLLFPQLRFLSEYNNTLETILLSVSRDSLIVLNNTCPLACGKLKNGTKYALSEIIKSNNKVNEGVFSGIDYKDHKVLAVLQPIPDTSWILLTKVDEVELYRSFNRQAFMAMLLLVMLLISASATLSYLYSRRQRTSEEKYYRMFTDSPQPMWIYDIQTLEFLEVNEAAVLHYGYTRSEFLSMTIKDIRPAEDVPLLIKDVAETVNPYNDAGIWRHLKKNGEIIYVNIKSHEVTFNKKTARHVLANDITQIKIAQDALIESEQKFRHLFENHSAVKIILDPVTGNIADANNAAAEFYGYNREELIGMNISRINTLHEAGIKQEIKNALSKSKFHFEFVHKRSDGTLRDVEVFSSKINIGGKAYLHSIVHDVTETKKAKHQNRLLIQSIEQSPVGIVITNPEGYVEFANSRMTDLTGFDKDEIIGSISRVLVSNKGNKALEKRIWSIIRSGDIWKGEYEDHKKDGSPYWAKIAISPILDDENAIKHFIMVFEDVSEQKKMLSELIRAKLKAEESDHLKTAFLANMSHEIRTPMNGILGFMDLLQEPGLTNDKLDEYINIVKTSGERLLSTINDIIDISKIESGQSTIIETEVNLNILLLEQYNFFKREADAKRIHFEISSLLPEGSHCIRTDHKKLASILTNLIKNALKFTKEGSIHFGAFVIDGMIEFKVSDTGKGIPEDKLKSIFDRFVQADNSIARDYEGSGLGLAISKAYVEMMGGRISVVSKVDVGSAFTFTIPFNHVSALKETNVNERVDLLESLEQKTILIAEDDEISFIYISRMLAGFKMKLIRAYNGQEAIDILEETPDISLILMDIKMPIMDGYQATKIIREKYHDIPILALTAFAFSDDKEKALAAGCSDYLSKPVKKDKLLEMIRRYAQKKSIA